MEGKPGLPTLQQIEIKGYPSLTLLTLYAYGPRCLLVQISPASPKPTNSYQNTLTKRTPVLDMLMSTCAETGPFGHKGRHKLSVK